MVLIISDQDWFEANLNPEKGHPSVNFELPHLLPEKRQRGFNGKAGKANLEKAFAFYLYIRNNYLLNPNPVIMDFGAGWGRIARFFLRDVDSFQNIWCVDPFQVAIDCMRQTHFPGTIIHSSPLPPIPSAVESSFDLIYAHSVFSHLNEEYFRSWVNYLLSLLKDDGFLVFTTRGSEFINQIEKTSRQPKVFGDYRELRRRYLDGEFLWFRDRGSSAKLSGDFFGETFIPRQYLEKEFDAYLTKFTEQVPNVDQAVVVFKRS